MTHPLGADRRGLALLRFYIVGGSSTLVSLATFAASFQWLHLGYHVAAVVAFLVAIVYSYLLHRSWTFREPTQVVSRAVRYVCISLAGLGLNLIVLTGLVSIGVQAVGAQALAILLLTPLRFTVNSAWTFKPLPGGRAA